MSELTKGFPTINFIIIITTKLYEEKYAGNRTKVKQKSNSNVINSHLTVENGLNDLFAMLVNGLMLSERESFLYENAGKGNKGNGYRKAGLKTPKRSLGIVNCNLLPIPALVVILGLLNQQEEQIKSLCFELYGKGLTTRQIEDVIENIYGNSYSKSSISRITTDFSALVDAWLNRTLDTFYPIVYIDAIHIKVRRDIVATEAFYILLGLRKTLLEKFLV